MSEAMTERRISTQQVKDAINLVCYRIGKTVDMPEPPCNWPRLCGEQFCRFPRYYRASEPSGLVAHVLLELGYPRDLLKALDAEYEIGEVLHPGVKIGRSRNAALLRIDRSGTALLAHLQEQQGLGLHWNDIAWDALKPRSYYVIPYLDKRRRPWLY